MTSNLKPDYGNHYYRVTRPFDVYVLIGYSESNTWIGASRMLGNVYRRLTLRAGDEVHALVGGTFAVTGVDTYDARIQLSEKHPFEKVYLPTPECWPLDALHEIPAGDARRVTRYRAEHLPRRAAGKVYGHGIDSVVGEEGNQ